MVIAVIPSRFHSSRLPGKALIPIGGVPLVARVARAVLDAGVAQQVIVATDHPQVARAAEAVGAQVRISQTEFRCGTDRVADVVRGLSGVTRVINVQGDEPQVDAPALQAALGALEGGAELGTLAREPAAGEDLEDPNLVKVWVHRATGRAAAFSRALDGPADLTPMVHVGLYAFEAAALARFASLPPSAGELAQDLEQLRAVEAGMAVGVSRVERAMISVNTPQDVARAEAALLHGPHVAVHQRRTIS